MRALPIRLAGALVAAAALAPTAASPARAVAADAPAEPLVERGVVYGRAGASDLVLDVARPVAGDPPYPAVLLLHAGAWRSGSRAEALARAVALARRGYVAAAADYRLAPAHPFPAAVEDVSCAVRFLRSRAAAWGVHPRRVAVWGEEAGGHLALLLGTLGPADGLDGDGGHAAHARDVQAVVAFHAPSDLTTWKAWASAEPYLVERYGKGSEGLLADFLAVRERTAPALARASPSTYVSRGDAPVLSVHGDADPLVPVDQPRALHRALRAVGVGGRLVEVAGGAHGFTGAQRDAAEDAAFAFLAERLSGAAPDTAETPSAAPSAPAEPGAGRGPRLDVDLVYRRAGGQPLHLDLARPAGDGPFPFVVAFHHGPYTPRARADLHDDLAWLAGEGIAAATVEYRGPVKGVYPTPVDDGRAAVAYLRSRAAGLGLDATRYAVMGAKVGGWVALHLALVAPPDGAPRPRGCVVRYAPTDLADACFDDNPTVGRLREVLAGASKSGAEAVRRASPITYADAGDPPVLVFHHPADRAIPFGQSERLVAVLTAAGVAARVERLTGSGHGSERAPQTPADVADFARARAETLAFLRRALGPPAPPR